MTVTQGHISKIKVTLHTYPKMVSGPQLLTAMFDLDKIYTIVFPDPRVRHDLDHRSYLKGQGHSTLIANICVRSITDHVMFDVHDI